MKNDICLSKVNVVFFVKYRFSVKLFEVIFGWHLTLRRVGCVCRTG